jgi:hypothetical protein
MCLVDAALPCSVCGALHISRCHSNPRYHSMTAYSEMINGMIMEMTAVNKVQCIFIRLLTIMHDG